MLKARRLLAKQIMKLPETGLISLSLPLLIDITKLTQEKIFYLRMDGFFILSVLVAMPLMEELVRMLSLR